MTFVELFAGIGGIRRGLEQAGHDCVGQVEIDPYCQQVLARHWPTTPRIADVRDFHGHEFGPFDLLAAGYPCQPFSQAGNQRGNQHEAHLWPEVARVLRNVRPRYIFVENVAGHLSLGFDEVLGTLAALGMDAIWDCVPASAIGAPHERDRLWLVAYADGDRESAMRLHDEASWLPSLTRVRWPEWAPDPATLGMDDGLPRGMDRRRLTALGNAVVPQVAELIGRRLPL
jgi:DNA (cytosine-5)-methyltransferase 1